MDLKVDSPAIELGGPLPPFQSLQSSFSGVLLSTLRVSGSDQSQIFRIIIHRRLFLSVR